MAYFDKILIANRGEVAIRIMRACRELGIETVGVYSDADKNALHVKYADEVFHLGASDSKSSYLNKERICEVAHKSGAEAIHPGYGFLAENSAFAKLCEDEGLVFIGPRSKVIEVMGSKIGCKRLMRNAGVPVLEGTEDGVKNFDEAREVAAKIGYPVITKASAGGGGIGMQIVNSEEELEEALEKAKRIAGSAFGDPTVFIEKYLKNPRHIEVQILGDSHGNAVHLFERDCSIQRRYQKLVEEAPCPIMTKELRESITQSALTVAKTAGYSNAGTVEFLYADGKHYFMEMNTRLQVEHTITEQITGLDLVKQQILIAAGKPLSFKQNDISIRGHAIECRINAEDPMDDFRADPGKILRYRSPGGPGIRVDSGVHMGYTIPTHYDSMISKLCSYGSDRTEAIQRMKRAIYEYVILGVKTTLPLHYAIMNNRNFVRGNTHTHFLQDEKIINRLRRYQDEGESRMRTLAESFRHGGEIAAVTVAVNAYVGKSQGKQQ